MTMVDFKSRTQPSKGDIDAATFDGNGSAFYLDINNIQGNIPIARGGTGLQALPSNGAILIGNGVSYDLTANPEFAAMLPSLVVTMQWYSPRTATSH